MSFGVSPWAPNVLLRPGDANVFMEVATANFQHFFDIVQTQLAEAFTEGGVAGKHKRQVRLKSDPLAPKYSPRGTWYHIKNKGGWHKCIKEKTDVSGGSSSGHTKRRLVRIPSSSRAEKTKKVRVGTKRKTPDEVLAASDIESKSCESRAASESEDE